MKSKKNCLCSGTQKKQYWSKLMESTKICKMSSGAQNFEKSITHAQGNNWRRKETKKSSKKGS